MTTADLDVRINEFLQRKYDLYPELAVSGRSGFRAVTYTIKMRTTGRVSFARWADDYRTS